LQSANSVATVVFVFASVAPGLIYLTVVSIGVGVALGAYATQIACRTSMRLRRRDTSELRTARQAAAIQLEEAARDLREAQRRRVAVDRSVYSEQRRLLHRSKRLVEIDRELGRRGEETLVS
jgi:hypothetical protein